MTATDTPRIYVASLSDYNAGRLHGAWIDAAQDSDSIAWAIEAMLEESPDPNAEEWAIHDYEGFGPIKIREFESIERIAGIAQCIEEYGRPFEIWLGGIVEIDELDDDANAISEQFEAEYMGEYESAERFVMEWADELGYGETLDSLPYWLPIDWAAAVNDLETGGDFIFEREPDPMRYGATTYVFERQ